jgi:hypothetical protein
VLRTSTRRIDRRGPNAGVDLGSQVQLFGRGEAAEHVPDLGHERTHVDGLREDDQQHRRGAADARAVPSASVTIQVYEQRRHGHLASVAGRCSRPLELEDACRRLSGRRVCTAVTTLWRWIG